MKKIIIGLVIGIAIGGGGVWWWFHRSEKPTVSPAKAAEQPDASPGVRLDRAQQTNAGIEVAQPVARELPREVKGYGRVLDPTALVVSLVDLDAAEAALDASKKEYDRITVLFAHDQNASARAVETAEAALKRDQAQVEGVRAKLIAGWGRPLIEQKDFRGLVRSLTNHETALVRVDLPISETLFSPPTGARIVSLAREERSTNAEFVGFATSADPQVQGQGFLFLLKENTLGLRPDMAVIGYLATGTDPLRGVVVPRGAVVRSEEKAWVYVQQDDMTFIKKLVGLDRPVDDGWFVAKDLTQSDRVVVSGAQILLSEEGKARFGIKD